MPETTAVTERPPKRGGMTQCYQIQLDVRPILVNNDLIGKTGKLVLPLVERECDCETCATDEGAVRNMQLVPFTIWSLTEKGTTAHFLVREDDSFIVKEAMRVVGSAAAYKNAAPAKPPDDDEAQRKAMEVTYQHGFEVGKAAAWSKYEAELADQVAEKLEQQRRLIRGLGWFARLFKLF